MVEIRPDTNEVVIGDNQDVFSDTLYANQLNFMPFEKLEGELQVEAKIRYSHQPAPCIISMWIQYRKSSV